MGSVIQLYHGLTLPVTSNNIYPITNQKCNLGTTGKDDISITYINMWNISLNNHIPVTGQLGKTKILQCDMRVGDISSASGQGATC